MSHEKDIFKIQRSNANKTAIKTPQSDMLDGKIILYGSREEGIGLEN